MSAPPPGYNEQASNLPDPGPAAAPIHMLRGGGGRSTPQIGGIGKDDETILEEYGLNNPDITTHIRNFDDSFKETFLSQIRSGKCSSKERSVTQKDCWAVTALIRATIQANLAKGNSVRLPGMLSDDGPEDETNGNILSDETRMALNDLESDTLAPCMREESSDSSLGMEGNNSLEELAELIPPLQKNQTEQITAPSISGPITEEEVNAAMEQLNTQMEAIQAQDKANQAELNKLPEPYKTLGKTIHKLTPDLLDEYIQIMKLNENDIIETARIIKERYGSNTNDQRTQSTLRLILSQRRSQDLKDFKLRHDLDRRFQSLSSSTTASVPVPMEVAPPVAAPVQPKRTFRNRLTSIFSSKKTPVTPPPVPSPPISASTNRMATPSNVQIQVEPATAAETTVPLASTAVLKPEYDEMGISSDFRKGQYGINLNANNSQRFYANALVGTKRMRIRGRNAANIKSKYNSKMKTLKNAAAAASSAAEQARKASLEATAARRAAEEARKIEDKRRKAAEQARKVEAKTAQSASRAAEVAALQARRAAGEKLSFMNRLRSVKNPFKRGGSRKTRRTTRRNRRR